MIRKKIIICIIIAASALSLSFTWPVQNPRITSTFGESRGDHFHDGIDIITGIKDIKPVDDGELVFMWDKSLFPTENYPGGGNYKILKHNNGYLSVYIHMEDNPSFQPAYSKDDVIGWIGNTGHSFGKHLHLSMLDVASRKSVNPLTIFPKMQDSKSPAIGDAYVRIEDKYYRIGDKSSIRLTRHYPLLVDIIDSMVTSEKLGIFKLKAVLNGTAIIDDDFSGISFTDRGLTVGGKIFNDLFDEKGYYKAPNVIYNSGINELLITAEDYSGNTSSKKISFNVDLDMQ